MIIFPAIDLYDKKAVRLYKGDYSKMTIYSDNPLSVAMDFEKYGATHIHMVDLEGARSASTPNLLVVAEIAEKTSLFVEIGGGIRNIETVEKYLKAGADRVILGTAALNDKSFLQKAVKEYGEKIAVGADARDGKIAVNGWLETSDVSIFDFLKQMEDIGVKNVICTDISRDGAMRGTNRELYSRLSEEFCLDITASGGISNIEDIKELRRLDLYGAIIGKAYYTGNIDLREALEAAK